MVKLADMLTRRQALIAARTGLAGLGGASLLAALHSGEEPSKTEAKKRNTRNQKASAKKKKKKNRRERSRRKKEQRRKRGRKHGGHGNNRGMGEGEGIQLETGSIVPESLISKTAGRFSVHMLLPFEDFPSEEKLAEAVAEGEELNLFILPDAIDVAVRP